MDGFIINDYTSSKLNNELRALVRNITTHDNYISNILTLRDKLLASEIKEIRNQYSALRYAIYSINSFKKPNNVDFSPRDILEDNLHLSEEDQLTTMILKERCWEQVATLDQLDSLPMLDDIFEQSAMLRGIARSNKSIPAENILQLVKSQANYTRALLFDLVATYDEQALDNLQTLIHERLAESKTPEREKIQLLDLAGAYSIQIYPNLLVDLLQQMDRHTISIDFIVSILDYIAACHDTRWIEHLHRFIAQRKKFPLAVNLALINTLAVLRHPSSVAIIEEYQSYVKTLGSFLGRTYLLEHLQQVHFHLSKSNHESQPALSGLTVVQCMCMTKLSAGAGLKTFVMSLGTELAKRKEIKTVYTVVLVNSSHADQLEERTASLVEIAAQHYLLNVPVYSDHPLTRRGMMEQEYRIQRALYQTLTIYSIDPDIFHIRYTGHGSKAVQQVAQLCHAKCVFTLTPDPHRGLSPAFGGKQLKQRQKDALNYSLQRVYVADYLLKQVDGITFIPHFLGLVYLTSYFPQLILEDFLKMLPFKIIPEGVTVLPQDPYSQKDLQQVVHQLFTQDTSNGTRQYRLAEEFKDRPIILNVGRMNPIKQQEKLVKAWLSGKLWRSYNLVLIGGNFTNPNAIERKVTHNIVDLIEKHPDVTGRFCFLPILPNETIRKLEYGINHVIQTDAPHVYACSSYKEEFGIAIVEAMEAGFLIFNPKRSGLLQYLDEGTNAFVMDTSTARSMRAVLEAVLLSGKYSAEDLQKVAQRGAQVVAEQLNIETSAQLFSEFYYTVIAGETL